MTYYVSILCILMHVLCILINVGGLAGDVHTYYRLALVSVTGKQMEEDFPS